MTSEEKKLSPSYFHNREVKRAAKTLAFNPKQDFGAWKRKVDRRLRELVGPIERESGPVRATLLAEERYPGYTQRKLRFRTLPDVVNVAYLLVPERRAAKRLPAVICLQGHSSGCHISIGKAIYPEDGKSIAGGRDIAVQAVRRGYVALALEQRCFGERKEKLQKAISPHPCQDAVMHSLMLGRTQVGERISDVMRAIDYLTQRDFVDAKRIACTGNSGGGTVTYYAGCLDPRIAVAAPSCSVCTWEDSIMRIYHCADNYLPRSLCYFEMADLSCLIAPRALIILAGAKDDIFPVAGARKAFRDMKAIYAKAGAAGRVHLAVGPEGHQYYPDLAWPLIGKYLGRG